MPQFMPQNFDLCLRKICLSLCLKNSIYASFIFLAKYLVALPLPVE